MGVTSIRFNKKEEKVLNFLKDYFHCDSSTILKRSLYEMYEDIKDKEIIDNFEIEQKDEKIKFMTYDDLFD